MDPLTVPIDRIDAASIDTLLRDKVSEGKTIEYKTKLPGGADGERIEFLADVSSFANAEGGHLLYGTTEDGGVLTSIPGLPGIDPDAEILRLQSMMQDGLDPRIPGVACQAVRLESGDHVLVVRVPSSWIAPHMVKFKQHSRFYSRNSAGKYALDVTELRTAFAFTESVGSRMTDFRTHRIGKVLSRDTPIPLATKAVMVLHLLPISAFTRRTARDLVGEGAAAQGLETFDGGYHDWWFNFDGILASGSINENGESRAYTQLFRNGCIEAAGTLGVQADRRRTIPSGWFEITVVDRLTSFLQYLADAKIEPPISIMLTLLGVRGVRMASREGAESRPVDRDVLAVPDVMFTSEQRDIPALIRPCFDAVWNACGIARSLNYDRAGKWVPRR